MTEKCFRDGVQSLSYGINLLRTLLLDRGHMERDRHFGIDPHDPREQMPAVCGALSVFRSGQYSGLK